MMKLSKTLMLAGIVAAVSGVAAPAFADDDARCGNAPRAEWMSVADIAAKATGEGYQVRGVDDDDGCWEVEAREKDGRKVDLHYHPVTGDLVFKDYDD